MFFVPFDILISKMLKFSIFDQFYGCPKFYDRPKSKEFPLRVKKRKNCPRCDFDSSKEVSWCTECNVKKSSCLISAVFEEFKKYGYYLLVSLDFSETLLCNSVLRWSVL
jgi:hypothetical protein